MLDWIMDTYFTVFLLFSIIVIDDIVCELILPRNPSCNKECQVAPHIRCTVIQDAPCESDSYKAENGQWPAEPATFDVSVTRGTTPLVKVFWNLPSDSSFSIVTGFLLRITSLSTKDTTSVHIDLDGTEWEPSDLNRNFQFTCLRDITQEGSYYLKIESLPLPNPEYTKMKDMFVAFNEVGVGSANWLSVIKIHVKVSPKKYSALHIYFKPAAPEVGFTGYDMALMDQNGNIIQTKPVRVAWTKEVEYKEVWFEKVCTGYYQLVLTPHNRSMYNDSCTCGRDSSKCQNCASASTSMFFANTERPCPTSVTPPTTHSTSIKASQIAATGGIKDTALASSNERAYGTTKIVIGISVVIGLMVLLTSVLGLLKLRKARPQRPEKENYELGGLSMDSARVIVWSDFMKTAQPPEDSEKFAERSFTDIKMLNYEESLRAPHDSGFVERVSLPDECGNA